MKNIFRQMALAGGALVAFAFSTELGAQGKPAVSDAELAAAEAPTRDAPTAANLAHYHTLVVKRYHSKESPNWDIRPFDPSEKDGSKAAARMVFPADMLPSYKEPFRQAYVKLARESIEEEKEESKFFATMPYFAVFPDTSAIINFHTQTYLGNCSNCSTTPGCDIKFPDSTIFADISFRNSAAHERFHLTRAIKFQNKNFQAAVNGGNRNHADHYEENFVTAASGLECLQKEGDVCAAWLRGYKVGGIPVHEREPVPFTHDARATINNILNWYAKHPDGLKGKTPDDLYSMAFQHTQPLSEEAFNLLSRRLVKQTPVESVGQTARQEISAYIRDLDGYPSDLLAARTAFAKINPYKTGALKGTGFNEIDLNNSAQVSELKKFNETRRSKMCEPFDTAIRSYQTGAKQIPQ